MGTISGTTSLRDANRQTSSKVEPVVAEAYCGYSGKSTMRRHPASKSWSSAFSRDGFPARIPATTRHWGPRISATFAARATVCTRSEEHTSELQSRQYLVCRLLLEKTK